METNGRLLLADVTLLRGTGIKIHVRFHGGTSKTRALAPRSIGSPIVVPAKGSSTT
ncbi:MAG: hypothetical protein WBE37_24560 [Bryobacteraceae bacterium]